MMKYIKLTSIRETDLPRLYDWINDRDLVINNSSYKPVSELQHKSWYEGLEKKNDLIIFAIRLQETDAMIGTCQLLNINKVYRSAELQIRIGETKNQNRGYGTEALTHLLQFAFKDLNLKRVGLQVFSSNKRAIKAYEKVGFIQEGILRHAAYINGEYQDVVCMGILDNEYFTKANP